MLQFKNNYEQWDGEKRKVKKKKEEIEKREENGNELSLQGLIISKTFWKKYLFYMVPFYDFVFILFLTDFKKSKEQIMNKWASVNKQN